MAELGEELRRERVRRNLTFKDEELSKMATMISFLVKST